MLNVFETLLAVLEAAEKIRILFLVFSLLLASNFEKIFNNSLIRRVISSIWLTVGYFNF